MSVDFGLFLRQGFKEEGRRGEQGAGGEKNGWGGGVLTKPSPIISICRFSPQREAEQRCRFTL